MLTAVIVLLLTSLSLLVVETIKSKNLAVDKLSSIGNVISLHSGAALSFNDRETAADTLAALSAEPNILYACLYDADERIFADYSPASRARTDLVPVKTTVGSKLLAHLKNEEITLFRRDGLHLLLPVIVSREKIGSLYIHAGLTPFYNRLYTYLIIIAAISLIPLFVAFFLSAKLQDKISRPIQKLTDAMAEVSRNKRYNLQLENTGTNEIALLYQGFNEMLHEIDKRDRDLMLTQYSMDHASDGICWIDKNGRITNASLGASTLLHFPGNKLLQSTIFQLWEDLSPEEWTKFWQLIDKSPLIQFSSDMLTYNGKKIPVEGSYHSVHLEQKLCCMLFRDVSERKKMERRYRELVEGTTDLIIQMDADGKLLYVNHMGEEIFGTDPEKLIEQSGFAFIHPDDRTITRDWFEQCLNNQTLQANIENRLVNQKTGSVRDMLWTYNFHYDEQGNPLSVNGIAHNITDRKQIETAIRQSKKQWDRTFDSFVDVVTLQDTDLRIIKANQAACTTLNLRYNEIVGRHCYELFSDRGAPCEEDCPLLKTRNTLKPHSKEMHHEKLGKYFWVSAAPVFDDEGGLEYIAHVAKDITEMKELEGQLVQSQKMEAIGTLAGGIAHDFNNILSAIIGYAEFIQQDAPAESQIGKNIKEIIGAGTRAIDLVRQLLTLSRKADNEKQLLHPHQIIKEALKMLRATIPASIAIEENIDPNCGTILANPTNIHQIIVNLCTNALHAMAYGKGTLSVDLQRRELRAADIPREPDICAGPFVVLTIRDSGCGMKRDDVDRIFEPFFTTREVGKGTGLGLSVVHGIVRDCRGFIEVDSSVGQGSTFSVYIPVVEETTGQPDASEQENRAAAPPTGQEMILVVDDDPLLVKINRKRLESRGYRVTALSDSREALKKFQEQPASFDLLITDLTMPGLTGDELAQAVLTIKPSLPIIMCTGYSETVSEEKALAMGIKKYIFKPMRGDELLEAVREVLDQ